MLFSIKKKIGFRGILGPPYYGIGATIRIDREMLCLPYAGFFFQITGRVVEATLNNDRLVTVFWPL